MPDEPVTVEEYLATLRADQRSALGELRALVHDLLAEEGERISYRMPTDAVTRIVRLLAAGHAGTSAPPRHQRPQRTQRTQPARP